MPGSSSSGSSSNSNGSGSSSDSTNSAYTGSSAFTSPSLGLNYHDIDTLYWYFLRRSEVDPIVASFSGVAVGVISALMVVEINNVKQQEHKRCR
ncbi:hypothetical protein R1sor_017828 [Riccia sorocarpa]|uniref:Uncharacterized protein n=1 Tax=Riccia sorocarpa TaxID=122646 RepID=A0ABD3IBY9_9MARC